MKPKPITQTKDGKVVATYDSVKEAMKATGFTESGIRKVLSCDVGKHKGFVFDYKEN